MPNQRTTTSYRSAPASPNATPQDIVHACNQAVATEAAAAYRYLILSQWAEGRNSPPLTEFFAESSEDEWQHATQFMQRVIELGGQPVMNPNQWTQIAYAPYVDPPQDATAITQMLQDSLDGEHQAIRFYTDLANKTFGRDHSTYQLAAETLRDQTHHAHELQSLLS